ncbi:P-loop containing nucleoside triphosphate hydrolase protein [Mycena sanguinolenta]|nr:P-loop containing nucleoside triphosphate hydrolase protein [Mycena sanguinolenta]
MKLTAPRNGAAISGHTVCCSIVYGYFYPLEPPILATSATLCPSALTEVCSGLDIDLPRSFFLNLGNDYPNITPSIIRMNGSKDYAAVVNVLCPELAGATSIADMPKTLVFVNAVKKTQILCGELQRAFPHLRDGIAFLHAHRTAKSKRWIMRDFRKERIKILVATEAAGMGADIPDIKLMFGRSAQDVRPDLPSYMLEQFFL